MIQSHIFRQKPNPLAGGCMSKRMAEHQATSAAGEHETKSNVNRCGLPCSVGAKETENLSRLHAQRKSIQRFNRFPAKEAAVFLGDVVEFKGGKHGNQAISSEQLATSQDK